MIGQLCIRLIPSVVNVFHPIRVVQPADRFVFLDFQLTGDQDEPRLQEEPADFFQFFFCRDLGYINPYQIHAGDAQHGYFSAARCNEMPRPVCYAAQR